MQKRARSHERALFAFPDEWNEFLEKRENRLYKLIKDESEAM
jgi:hypothetical protein